MSFVDRVIHVLDEYVDSEYFESPIQAIREHIETLINTKEDTQELLSYNDLDLNIKNLAIVMSERIYDIVSTYEYRAKILSIEYDETLAPWQLKFFLTLQYNKDLTNFNIQIIFNSNRYYEVL